MNKGNRDKRESDLVVFDEQGVYLGQAGAFASGNSGFDHPMYMDVAEVLDLMKIEFRELAQKEISYFRTLETGTFEEFVVIENSGDRRALLFRVWPILFGLNKRLEYKVYSQDQDTRNSILYYLDMCARSNNAKLVLKQ